MFPNAPLPAAALPHASLVEALPASMTSANDVANMGIMMSLTVSDGTNTVTVLNDPLLGPFVLRLAIALDAAGIPITASVTDAGKLRLTLDDPSFTQAFFVSGVGRFALGLPNFAIPTAGGTYDTDTSHVRVAGEERSLADALTALPPAPSSPLAVLRVDGAGTGYELVDVGGRDIPYRPASVTGSTNPFDGGPPFALASPLSDYGLVDGDVIQVAYTDFVIGQGIAATQTIADLLAAIQVQTNVVGTVEENGAIKFERAPDLYLGGSALGKIGHVAGAWQQTSQFKGLACTDNLFHNPTAQVLQGLLEELRTRVSLLEAYVQSHP